MFGDISLSKRICRSRSPEAVVCLQDVHDRPHGWSQDLVHGEHGGVAAGLIMSGNAGVLDAQVL